MGTGPKAREGFDLAFTEVLEDGRHYLRVEVGSPTGEDVIAELAPAPAAEGEERAAGRATERAVAQMGREMDVTDIRDLLYRNLEHPRWDDVAERCLTCGNCTMVCPTCFCTTVEETTDLTGEHVERHQRWDSCFTVDYSRMHGGSVRRSSRSRYRQWMIVYGIEGERFRGRGGADARRRGARRRGGDRGAPRGSVAPAAAGSAPSPDGDAAPTVDA